MKVLLFTSNNCAPCKVLKPELMRLKKERNFELDVFVLEDGAEPFTEYKIRNVPAVICMKGAKEVGRLVGASTPAALVQKLEGWGL